MNAVLFAQSYQLETEEAVDAEISMADVLGVVGPGFDQIHLSPQAAAGLERAEMVDRLECDFHHVFFRKVYHLPRTA